MWRRLFVLALVTAALAACGSAESQKQYWDHRTASELPPSADVSVVDAFFGHAGLEHSYDARSNTIYAIQRNVSSFGLASYSVEIKCGFDESRRLQACTSQVSGDGP
jgi:hypothetical protein